MEELEELSEAVKNNSLCALGQTAANPIVSTITHFKDEYLAHIEERRCPAGTCKSLMKYRIDRNKCFGCKLCARNCPVSAISVSEYTAPGKKKPALHIDQDKCIKCGMCRASCKFGAKG